MATRRAESQARTREKLLDAAGQLFVERGLRGASVEAIAERAGYTRGAFYSNFSSKEEIFAELLQDRVYSVYRAMVEARLAAEGPPPSARETGDALAYLQGDPNGRWLFRLWLELLSHATRSEEMRALAAEFWRSNRELTARVVERGSRRRHDLPPDTTATLLIALDIGLAIQHHVDPDAVPLSVYPEIFAALFDP